MKNYTGWEWLLIDAANNCNNDLDKETFETRIEWGMDNLNVLEAFAAGNHWKERPLFVKAVNAIRKAQKKVPTGHLVEVDASCSGIQIMSALTGCIKGAEATGLVDPNKRADAYTALTKKMQLKLGTAYIVARSDAKDAFMTAFYGSKDRPRKIFGANTTELDTFYESSQEIAPGAWQLLQDLLASWQPYALEHAWELPDGFISRVLVKDQVTKRVEIDELDHTTFSVVYKENKGTKYGLSNAANVVHSVDAFVLRQMGLRCLYDPEIVSKAKNVVETILSGAAIDHPYVKNENIDEYARLYKNHQIAVMDILPYMTINNSKRLPLKQLKHILRMINDVQRHKPFGLVTRHDAYASHANNVNHVRWHYKELLADLAEGDLLSSVFSDIYGSVGNYPKINNSLGPIIRNSNYALT